MTSAAPAVPPTMAAPAAPGAPSTSQAGHRDPRADFRKPLQQARQQQQQASSSPSQPAAPRDSVPLAARHADKAAAGDAQDHAKDEDTAAATSTPDAAGAMLALLGQSIPAQATPAPVAADAQGNAAAAAAALPATLTGAPAPGLVPPGPQAGADNMLDTQGIGVLKGDAQTSTAQDAGDDAGADAGSAFTDALAAAKGLPSTSTAQPSADTDHGDPLQALNALAATPLPQAQSAPATPAAHALTMQSSVGTPAFAQELGQQVAWLGGQDIKQARIRLHPEDLGQLDVKVSVKQDHVDVAFIAQHPQAVHAVQQTLGQLDMMLAHHGLSLGHAEVGQGGRGNESGQGGSSAGTSGSADDAGQETGGVAPVAAPVTKAIGLLDMFA